MARIVLAILWLVALVLAGQGPAFASATDAPTEKLLAYAARIAGDDARTRIVIDFDQKPEFEIRYIASPDRIVVDLPATAFGFAAETLAPTGLFSDIRYGSMDDASARLVLTAARPARLVTAEAVENEDGKGYRLVLDAELVPQQDFAALVAAQAWTPAEAPSPPIDPAQLPVASAASDFVIAIDAGHGGIDTGATGATSKTAEKDITLAFAKVLHDKLGSEPGIRTVLTRDTDRFLSLSERVVVARQKGAQLLISLHADTLRQSDIRGATVYTISDKASDHMAAQLAERENFSDTLGGVEMPAETEEVNDILLDLTRRETQAFSISLAQAVVGSFEGQISLINNPHRHAGFRVLQAPDMPSILLELGFLSNKDDEKLLLDPAWREKVADLLVEAVRRYRAPLVANGG
ncbi:N-acetylmuramoyl-L-alanine amidase [Rhizobium sp. Root274]|uniref:N-acetylmuramoyl-L-alanine amidase n=1 Tax=unclassified Rhizobium TaxID=2613769 RepID=UPI000712E7CC|nr:MULTISPECIES: N-acetylmuramoyl-L-alanine amidase [unclassified Rhizobium]KQW32236.1 N-acetylmuramoyl-L-alanine amidase [Rhizobium sp. Root1240]KRD33778.1 N-acetylmuramoyl-L-alanine amidase [Rhizobium sp. Root274]